MAFEGRVYTGSAEARRDSIAAICRGVSDVVPAPSFLSLDLPMITHLRLSIDQFSVEP